MARGGRETETKKERERQVEMGGRETKRGRVRDRWRERENERGSNEAGQES